MPKKIEMPEPAKQPEKVRVSARTKSVALLIAVLLCASSVFAGRTAFEASASVINVVDTSTWIHNTYDVYLRGDDGKLFMLHFHDNNPLAALNGKHLRFTYVQEFRECQTGYVNDVISVQQVD